MTDQQRIDPERLAALLDGRLGADEAAAVRAQLAHADDDTLSAYADAVAVSAELERGSATGIVAIDSWRQRRRWILPALVAAAAVAVLMFRARPSDDAYAPTLYAAAIPASVNAVNAPVWAETRGGTDGLSNRARAARAGALLADMELGAIRGDTSRAASLALATVMDGVPGGVAVSGPLRELAASPSFPAPKDRRETLGRQVIQFLDPSVAAASAYLEAARLATASGDATFFDRSPADALTPLARNKEIDASLKSALEDIVRRTHASPRDAAALHARIVEALRTMAQ